MYTGVVANFMGFTAVGVIIIAMVGVGVAEESGLVKVLIRKLVIVAPRWALTWILTFVGILSSVAADAGYLVLIPLAAAAFLSVGRHPLAGLAVGFASVAAAFLVNILIVPVDGILTEITNDAIRLVDPNRSIDLAANVWFSIGSVVLLTVLIVLITERVIEPRLGAYTGDYQVPGENVLSEAEYRGLRYAGYALLGVLAFIALLLLPPGAPLRNPTTGAIISGSPFMNSLIVTIALIFLVTGAAYGRGAGTMKTSADIIAAIQKSIGGLAGLILLLLVISQFIAFFNYTNMATLAAVSAATYPRGAEPALDRADHRLRDRGHGHRPDHHRGHREMGDLRAGLRAAADAARRGARGGAGGLSRGRQPDERDHAAQRLFRDDRHLRHQVPEGCRRRHGDRADAALCHLDLADLDRVPGGLVPARPALGPVMARGAAMGHKAPAVPGPGAGVLDCCAPHRPVGCSCGLRHAAGAGAAARPARPEPDGSVEIEQVRVGVLAVGTSIGGGRLQFRGEEHSLLGPRHRIRQRRRLIPVGARGSVQPAPARGFRRALQRTRGAAPAWRGIRARDALPAQPAGVELRLRTERAGGQWRFNEAGVTIELR